MTGPPPGSRSVDEILAATTPADFDGHTAFATMTAEERLDALGRMIAVVRELRGLAAAAVDPPAERRRRPREIG